ncbi:MAG: hypothetical protein ORN58_07500 [Sediminibacterium sp.]|nr:hypothetical protein [Sediminibacterium sp.]
MKKLLLFITIFTICNYSFAQTDSTQKLKDYVGTYKFPEGSIVPTVNVSIENGGLIIGSIQGTSTLEKQGEDLYIITAFNGTCLFKRNDAKVVIGVHIEAGGYVLDGDKLPNDSIHNIKKMKK